MTTSSVATSTVWKTAAARDVRPGDRVRVQGQEIVVSRIEPSFFGRENMIAFIEDTEERWLKVPTAGDATIEVRRGA